MTTTKLQVPGLEEAHKYVEWLNRLVSTLNSPLTWYSGVTQQQ